MFLKNKKPVQVDNEQREFFEHSYKRMIQKKRLFQHFVLFLIGSVFFIIINLALGFGKDITFFNVDWFVYAVLFWALLLIIHMSNVWLFSTFVGEKWKKAQIERLTVKQKEEIALLQKEIDLLYPKEELLKRKENLSRSNQVNNPDQKLL